MYMYMLKYNIRYLKKLFTNNFENKLNLPKKNALKNFARSNDFKC